MNQALEPSPLHTTPAPIASAVFGACVGAHPAVRHREPIPPLAARDDSLPIGARASSGASGSPSQA